MRTSHESHPAHGSAVAVSPLSRSLQRDRTSLFRLGGTIDNAGTQKTPFRTVERARDAVRALAAKAKPADAGDRVPQTGVRITLARTPDPPPGRWGQVRPVPVTYRAYKKEHLVISGGRVVTGWKESRRGGRRIWSASLRDVAIGTTRSPSALGQWSQAYQGAPPEQRISQGLCRPGSDRKNSLDRRGAQASSFPRGTFRLIGHSPTRRPLS